MEKSPEEEQRVKILCFVPRTVGNLWTLHGTRGRMIGWMDGWLDGWMDGLIDRRIGGSKTIRSRFEGREEEANITVS